MAEFELQDWYPSDATKRHLGSISKAVNETMRTVGVLGSEKQPLLVLEDADVHDPDATEVVLTIDEAKADWSNITTAAATHGTRFRIMGRQQARAVLFRHPKAKDPLEKYRRRAASPDLDRIAQTLDAIAKDIRRLGRSLSSPPHLDPLISRLNALLALIECRHREVWRGANDYPLVPSVQ